MGHDVSSTCPKCNLEKKLQITMLENALTTKPYERRFLVKKKNTIKSVVEKLNINLLAKYVQQAGRLAEYGQ